MGDGPDHRRFRASVEAIELEICKVMEGGRFETMEVHESFICQPCGVKFFLFGICPRRRTCSVLFLYVATQKCVSPAELIAFLIHSGVVGYCGDTGSFRYILQMNANAPRTQLW